MQSINISSSRISFIKKNYIRLILDLCIVPGVNQIIFIYIFVYITSNWKRTWRDDVNLWLTVFACWKCITIPEWLKFLLGWQTSVHVLYQRTSILGYLPWSKTLTGEDCQWLHNRIWQCHSCQLFGLSVSRENWDVLQK